MKINCWEYKKCGRDLINSSVESICPTLKELTLNGVHGGTGAGRACWVIAGTFCGGSVQGVFAEKIGTCIQCGFYKKVRSEEKANFKKPGRLIDIVHSKHEYL
jgi:hypothetical protein